MYLPYSLDDVQMTEPVTQFIFVISAATSKKQEEPYETPGFSLFPGAVGNFNPDAER
jgi:hypothetical protein